MINKSGSRHAIKIVVHKKMDSTPEAWKITFDDTISTVPDDVRTIMKELPAPCVSMSDEQYYQIAGKKTMQKHATNIIEGKHANWGYTVKLYYTRDRLKKKLEDRKYGRI